MKLSSLTVVFALVVSWTIKIGLCLREKFIIEERINIKETSSIFVYRSGSKLAISEEDLTIGDLVFIDYNQAAPATGILVSKEEIELD